MSLDWGSTGLRTLGAALAVALYLLLCAAIVFARRRAQHRAARERDALAAAPASGAAPWLIAYASQTGVAESLALHTAQSLHAEGTPARVVELGALTADELANAERALFITSTYGEGDPPDSAAPFARKLMTEPLAPSLSALRYGVLALGDREYTEFCGFGRALDGWLQRSGAVPLFERIDVDAGDDAALRRWREQLGSIMGRAASADDDDTAWQVPPWGSWRIAARRHLNPGSAGAPTFHIELVPADKAASALPSWESGDLVELLAPGDLRRPREYSIASVPADGSVHLLVRQERHPDGTLGVASGWLTAQSTPDDAITLRLRPHRGFRLGANAERPLILIGNGTGLAGLRSHLKARAANGVGRNWLVFGERQAAFDSYHRDEIEAWRASGVLERADLVFSRDQPERRYVQHRLREAGDELRRWLADGAAVYVCGSLEGMAGGVDAALEDIAGIDGLQALAESGRYRRDVY